MPGKGMYTKPTILYIKRKRGRIDFYWTIFINNVELRLIRSFPMLHASFMLLQVFLQVALLSKMWVADFTNKGLLSQMHSGMVKKIPSFNKLLIAPFVLAMDNSLFPFGAPTRDVAEFMLISFKDFQPFLTGLFISSWFRNLTFRLLVNFLIFAYWFFFLHVRLKSFLCILLLRVNFGEGKRAEEINSSSFTSFYGTDYKISNFFSYLLFWLEDKEEGQYYYFSDNYYLQ